MALTVNGETVATDWYEQYHGGRFAMTLDLVRKYGGGKMIEVGAYPFAMTSKLAALPGVEIAATVSAGEVTYWADPLPMTRRDYEVVTETGQTLNFPNYSANIERDEIVIEDKVDVVLACEILEHLTRAPHRMMLNINSWLKPGGIVIMTTPNGSQMENPFRVRAKMPAYQPSVYFRHNYVFTMDQLTDLVEATGFEVLEATFMSPYVRKGGSNLYRAIYGLGPRYLKNKFAQTVCVVARKVEDRTTASRLPKCYANEPGWERVDGARPARWTEQPASRQDAAG